MQKRNIKEQLEAEGQQDDFTPHDMVTGRKGINVLNKKKLGKHEMFEIFGMDYIK